MPASDRIWWPPERDAELVRLYRQDVTLVNLAGAFGVEVHHVWSRLVALRREGIDLPPRRPRWTDERRALLAQCRRDGYSLRELEMEFERSRGTITSQLRTLRSLGYDVTSPNT